MEHQEKTDFTIRYLLAKSLEGSINPDEINHLNQLIIEDPRARRYYVEYLHIHVTLRKILQKDPAAVSAMEEEILDDRLWQQLAVHEQTAESIETASAVPMDAAFLQPAAPKSVRRRVSRFTIFTFAASLAALLLLVAWLNLPFLNPVEVATVTDSIKAEYATETLEKGSRLTNRKGRYYLEEGISSIQFDSGAAVVIEAPAEFELKSMDKMVLFSGRLYANVPRKAIGFAVETLDSTVVDLGTEFGVYAVPMQGTELHVFEGKTQMTLPRSSSMLDVTEGQAQRIETATGRIQSIALGKNSFVRKIDSENNLVWKGQEAINLTEQEAISLSDLAMGGDGHGSSTQVCANFDPSSGAEGTFVFGQYQKNAGNYHKILSNPFLDGVFVPQGTNQIVSSEGHVFVDCPQTSGLYFSGLRFDREVKYFPQIQDRYQQTRHLSFAEAMLFMHSNLGLTVDLNAIRQQFPGRDLCRFRTTAGTAFTSSIYGQFFRVQEWAPGATDFDVWVLVDGQLRSSKTEVRWDSLVDIVVPVSSADRFLSIIVTDGEEVHVQGCAPNHYDFCALADPRFEVEISK